MKYPKLRELKEAIKAIVKGPYTSKFPVEPHIPHDNFRGMPEFFEDDCVGCGACANVCPARAIDITDEGDERTLTYRCDRCIFCAECEMNCLTEKGVLLSNQYDLATTGNREDVQQVVKKKLVLCDLCGEVVAPYDQLKWVAENSGTLLYSNASLLNVYFREKGMASESNPTEEGSDEITRASRVEVLCPLCRRESVFTS